jgi:DNA-binding transcriptional MerR regulator
MGLLSPIEVNSKTGYRYYSIGQSACLDMIQYYKEIGLSLKDIKERLNEVNLNTMPEILQERYDYIDKEMKKLKLNQAAILRSIESFNRYLSLPQIGTFFFEYIPERTIYVYNTGADLFSYTYYDYEYYLRQFKDNLEKNGFPSTFFANVGTMVRQKYLRKNELYSDEIFVFIDKSPDITLPIETIPAGTYLSLCCDVYEDEKKYAEKLLDEMQTHHLKPLGDYFCEVVTEYPDSSNGQRKIFYKMQVKVK